jgi:hypothetical protein
VDLDKQVKDANKRLTTFINRLAKKLKEETAKQFDNTRKEGVK